MSSMHDYFNPSGSGYAIHRTALRRERLPECCRNSLTECSLSIKYLGNSGENVLLPLVKCGVCGRLYAQCGEKYMPVDNPLKYEMTDRQKPT